MHCFAPGKCRALRNETPTALRGPHIGGAIVRAGAHVRPPVVAATSIVA